MKKSGKFTKKCQSQGKVRENEIVLANDLEIVDIAHFVSVFCQTVRAFIVTFCYTADKFRVREKNNESQGKVRGNGNLKRMAIV